jgi:hypothetical protein
MILKTAILSIFFLAIILQHQNADACTSAVVSSKASADGRAILWKHRDSPSVHNEVLFLEDGKYSYVAVVNAGDDVGREIWMGVNEKGLAVMNTASDDLAVPEEPKDGEGRLLKLLLQSCSTVDEVEAFLRKTDSGGRDVTTNIGAIDHASDAAYFEVGQKSFKRFDANQQSDAPRGYLLRTNFAETAPKDKGGGYIRYERERGLFDAAWKRGKGIGAEFILSEVSLDLANEMTGIDPRRRMPPSGVIDASDTINRAYSVADAVFVSATKDEPGFATTMWVALGQPIASLAIPVWPVPQNLVPELNGKSQAKLEEYADAIRKKLYPQAKGNQNYYLNAREALTVRKELDVAQQQIFQLAAGRLKKLRQSGNLNSGSLADVTQACVELAEKTFQRLVDLSAPSS